MYALIADYSISRGAFAVLLSFMVCHVRSIKAYISVSVFGSSIFFSALTA
ncbi:hypothetical protein [Xenorhabdus bovienii]